MATNYEPKYVDMALLVCFGIVLLFDQNATALPESRRHYICFLCSLAALGIFTGIVRQRVELIGEFFYPRGAHYEIGNRLFPHLRTGRRFPEVIRQLDDVLGAKPIGPVFFGPRMEFGYAAFGLPSPEHIPLWWHPGTSFALDQEPVILQRWKAHRFRTLIFLKDDFSFYSPLFLTMLSEMYVRDDHYSELTILRLK